MHADNARPRGSIVFGRLNDAERQSHQNGKIIARFLSETKSISFSSFLFDTHISLTQLIRCVHTAPRTLELLAPHKAIIQPAVSAGERAYDAGETGLQFDTTYEREFIELPSALCVEESGRSTLRMARKETPEGTFGRCFTPRPQNYAVG